MIASTRTCTPRPWTDRPRENRGELGVGVGVEPEPEPKANPNPNPNPC